MVKNLKFLRTNKGLSQQQLAEVIGTSQQSINKYENHNDINGDKRDNRPENLIVFASQKLHAKWHNEHKEIGRAHV